MHGLSETYRVYLAPAEFVDSDHPTVRARARDLTRIATSDRDKAIALFAHVRDLRYGAPDFDRLDSFKASTVLREGGGYCVPKASAFVALCRASNIPARLAFADVTNHLATPRTLELMGGELFAWHGYAEVLLDGRWLKASPTFDSKLCERLGVAALTFDGRTDAHLQSYDAAGRTFMSYDRHHGTFHDVPARFLAEEMPRLYPKAYAAIRAGEVS
jgi:transglutaminase-like putative cysteine protease